MNEWMDGWMGFAARDLGFEREGWLCWGCVLWTWMRLGGGGLGEVGEVGGRKGG